MFTKKYSVSINKKGGLFIDNKFEKVLDSGVYKFSSFKDIKIVEVSDILETFIISNQEAITKDNLSIRYSYYVNHQVKDAEKYLKNTPSDIAFYYTEQAVSNLVSSEYKKLIASYTIDELNENREKIVLNLATINKELEHLGLVLEKIEIRDLIFPKPIQVLLSKKLEAKINAETALETARTSVATARTLKNASELMKGDENMKYLQFLETIQKISEKGNHTFNIEK